MHQQCFNAVCCFILSKYSLQKDSVGSRGGIPVGMVMVVFRVLSLVQRAVRLRWH